MLGGHADFAFKTRIGLCRQNYWREFDGLRARAEDERSFHRLKKVQGSRFKVRNTDRKLTSEVGDLRSEVGLSFRFTVQRLIKRPKVFRLKADCTRSVNFVVSTNINQKDFCLA